MREFFKVPSLTQDLLELSLRGSVNLKKEMESREEEWRSWVWCKVRASLVEIVHQASSVSRGVKK